MSVAASIDDYALANLGIFFTATSDPASGKDGDLTGQCVTLGKWVLHDFTDIPNPFAARGHARYYGINLVNQGLAFLVPAGQEQPGDLVCYEFGEYGHMGALLSGRRLFQQNANVTGAIKRILANGTIVYSTTIVPLYSSLGGVAPKFYRLKNYKEGVIMKDDQIRRTCLYMRLAAGQSVEQANANSDNDLKQIKANPDYMPALAKQIYDGNEVFRWKGAHYDEQVKVSFDNGYQAGEAAGGAGPEYTVVSEVNGVPKLFTRVEKEK